MGWPVVTWPTIPHIWADSAAKGKDRGAPTAAMPSDAAAHETITRGLRSIGTVAHGRSHIASYGVTQPGAAGYCHRHVPSLRRSMCVAASVSSWEFAKATRADRLRPRLLRPDRTERASPTPRRRAQPCACASEPADAPFAMTATAPGAVSAAAVLIPSTAGHHESYTACFIEAARRHYGRVFLVLPEDEPAEAVARLAALDVELVRYRVPRAARVPLSVRWLVGWARARRAAAGAAHCKGRPAGALRRRVQARLRAAGAAAQGAALLRAGHARGHRQHGPRSTASSDCNSGTGRA